jgi:hypothetical protein
VPSRLEDAWSCCLPYESDEGSYANEDKAKRNIGSASVTLGNQDPESGVWKEDGVLGK